MSFIKHADIKIIALAEGEYDKATDSVAFTKQADKKVGSVYQTAGTSKINVADLIKKIAKEYNLSDDPSDYFFEAARAVTADVPNQNGDAFEKSELLRFDHRLGQAVYQTFILKPHQINHRADNPKTARGFVIDASYNDTSAPLDECPGCGNKTASLEDDSLGCTKCGHIIKDEFVELLLAIDTKKDPTFAAGVKSGALDSLSMGCEAKYTDCSICDHRAYSVSQFCNHIKSGNKKKIFKTASGPKMAYEKCGGVIFTEISRVDQPADPTAKQREVFNVGQSVSSDMSMLAQRVDKLEAKLFKGAQLMDADSTEREQILDKAEEFKTTHPEFYNLLTKYIGGGSEGIAEPMSIDDYEKKHQESMNKDMSLAELGMKPEVTNLPHTQTHTSAFDINAELDQLINQTNKASEEQQVSASALKFAKSYQDLEVQVTDKGNVRVFNPKGTLFVIRPEVKPTNNDDAIKVATSVLTDIANNGLVDVMIKHKAIAAPHVAQVLQYHVEDFDGGREEGDKKGMPEGGEGDGQLQARESPEKSMVGEEHTDRKDELRDMKKLEKDDVLKEHVVDHKEKQGEPKSILDKEISDMDEARAKPSKSTLKDLPVDFADKQPKTGATKIAEKPDFLKKKDEEKADSKDEKKEAQMSAPTPSAPMPSAPTPVVGMPASAAPHCDCECGCSPGECKCDMMKCSCAGCSDMKMAMTAASKKYVSRMERLYKSRMEKISKEAELKVASAEKSAMGKLHGKLLRSLKLAAKRQALNMEASPLKAKMFDILCNELELDSEHFYPGMDAHTASTIIEATASGAFDEFIDALMKRASELINMNDEAFSQIEADVKNLQPMSIAVEASASNDASNGSVRQAAVNGNMILASGTTNEVVSNGNTRNNIRSALGSTKVSRTSQTYLK